MPTTIGDELDGSCCRLQCAPCNGRNVSRPRGLEDLDRRVSKAPVPQEGPNAPFRPASHRLLLKVLLPQGPHSGLGLDVAAADGERRQDRVRVNRRLRVVRKVSITACLAATHRSQRSGAVTATLLHLLV